MSFSGGIQFGLLAEGLFELLWPILIFGVYIVASIVKTVAKKGQKDDSDEEPESELKKAVRRRYQEIHQKQVGKPTQKPSEPQHLHIVQPRPVQQTVSIRQPQRSQWEVQQEAIRQRNAKLQSQRTVPKRPQVNVPKQVLAAISQPKPKPIVHQRTAKTVDESQKKTGNLLSMLKGPENLRSAIILKEILDKPLALREV